MNLKCTSMNLKCPEYSQTRAAVSMVNLGQCHPSNNEGPWLPLTLPDVYRISLFWTFHTNGIVEQEVLCAWLLSLYIFARFTHVVACVRTSLL
jgi:hypothetical protein